MNRLIFPDIFGPHVTAFFTGKIPGAGLHEISALLKIREEDIFLPIQKHTDKVLVLDSAREPRIADAVVTREEGILIGVQVADCVPVLVCEKEKGVYAAVHAGWRGTAEGILKKTIEIMKEKFMCRAQDILVAIGPSIKGCCYEVDYEVVHKVGRETGEGEYFQKKGEKYYLDLALANRLQAVSMGVSGRNIWVSPDCTFSNPDKYYSYRFSQGSTGRQAAFIGKMPPTLFINIRDMDANAGHPGRKTL